MVMSDSEETYPRVMGHIGVAVGDIEAAFEWYRDVLGFTPVMEPDRVVAGEEHFGELAMDAVGEDFGEMKIAHMATGNHVGFELFEFEGVEDTEPNALQPGVTHFCVQDPDMDEAVERIVENGGEQLSSKIWDIFPDRSDYQMCYCADPWGNIVELHSQGYEHMHSNLV
jgi:catechol 2,3-dioxygenase-like lactoylglutathione lyase family enzyme